MCHVSHVTICMSLVTCHITNATDTSLLTTPYSQQDGLQNPPKMFLNQGDIWNTLGTWYHGISEKKVNIKIAIPNGVST